MLRSSNVLQVRTTFFCRVASQSSCRAARGNAKNQFEDTFDSSDFGRHSLTNHCTANTWFKAASLTPHGGRKQHDLLPVSRTIARMLCQWSFPARESNRTKLVTDGVVFQTQARHLSTRKKASRPRRKTAPKTSTQIISSDAHGKPAQEGQLFTVFYKFPAMPLVRMLARFKFVQTAFVVLLVPYCGYLFSTGQATENQVRMQVQRVGQ